MAAVLQFYRAPEAEQAGVTLGIPREGDAGFDLPAVQDTEIAPKSFLAVKTGIHLAIPEGFVGLVRDRSSVALRGGVCSAGVIDASYRGEVKVVMHNMSDTAIQFKKGDRIAQILILPFLPGSQSSQVTALEHLGDTVRGAGGFGSTGK